MSRSRSDVAAFHPDLRTISRVLPRAAFAPRTLTLMKTITRVPNLIPRPGIRREDLGDGVGVRVHEPAERAHDGGAILWIHGGGYVIGSAAQDDGICARLATRLSVPVIAVDYRLAPKHPYPVPLQDCLRALTWVGRLPGVDPDRIVVAGASAGGGLSAAVALAARDGAAPLPLFSHLLYPMVDDTACDRPGSDSPYHRMWNPACNRMGWSLYLGDADRGDAVPARAADLAGLPPTWIGVGTLDPLLDEDRAYAERLRAAGVACTLDVVDGAFHGFDAIAPRTAVARAFTDRQVDVLRAAFAGRDPHGSSDLPTDHDTTTVPRNEEPSR